MESYNKQQRMYIRAQANLGTLLIRQDEVDQKYIKENNIVNPDGSIPRASWAVDDEALCEKAMADCSKIVTESGLWDEILKAREFLKLSEENLLMFGLSIAPSNEKQILEKAVKEDYTTRMKVIDLVLKLDVRTIRKAAR